MKNLSYITLFFIIFLVTGCFIKITKSAPPSPPKVYPKEANFLEEMGLGDTVHIFIKESGYFQPTSNPHYKSHLTCYTKMEICRVDTFTYHAREYYALPGGPSQSGPNFEFDTVKFDLKKTINSCGNLDLWCLEKRNVDFYVFGDTCLIPICCGIKEIEKAKWRDFVMLGMTDVTYQKWRFDPPRYDELEAWRTSMQMNQSPRLSRFELLSFYKDTCKISYCDRLPVPYSYDFSRLR